MIYFFSSSRPSTLSCIDFHQYFLFETAYWRLGWHQGMEGACSLSWEVFQDFINDNCCELKCSEYQLKLILVVGDKHNNEDVSLNRNRKSTIFI